jgi:hypothetical protein
MIGRTSRGFAIYAEFSDGYGADVSVIQSSSAERDCVWIFTEGGAVSGNKGSVLLTKDLAVEMRDALNAWLLEVEG